MRLRLFVLVLLVASAERDSIVKDWRYEFFDAANSGFFPHACMKPTTVAWIFSGTTSRAGSAPVILSGGDLIVFASTTTLYSVSGPCSGTVAWSRPLLGSVATAPVLSSTGHHVFIGVQATTEVAPRVLAVSAASGNPIWPADITLASEITTPLRMMQELLVVITGNTVQGFASSSGTLLWKCLVPFTTVAPAIVQSIYVVASSSTLYRIDPAATLRGACGRQHTLGADEPLDCSLCATENWKLNLNQSLNGADNPQQPVGLSISSDGRRVYVSSASITPGIANTTFSSTLLAVQLSVDSQPTRTDRVLGLTKGGLTSPATIVHNSLALHTARPMAAAEEFSDHVIVGVDNGTVVGLEWNTALRARILWQRNLATSSTSEASDAITMAAHGSYSMLAAGLVANEQVVLVPMATGELYALNISSGTPAWTFGVAGGDVGVRLSRPVSVASAGQIVAVTDNGRLVLLDNGSCKAIVPRELMYITAAGLGGLCLFLLMCWYCRSRRTRRKTAQYFNSHQILA